MPTPVMTRAIPPTTTATVAAAAASPRCSGARVWAPRGRAPAAEAARIGRRLVIGDGLYAAPGAPAAGRILPRPMPFELPVDPRQERRAPITRWLGTAFGVLLVVLVLYFGYVGYEGSRQLTNADTDSTDCRTPSKLGWLYEAINYPIGSDALLAEQPDQAACTSRGARPGGEIVGPGGVRLAGWYIPATAEIGPTGTTVILAHGWGGNKSEMLSRAATLHDRYNLVL